MQSKIIKYKIHNIYRLNKAGPYFWINELTIHIIVHTYSKIKISWSFCAGWSLSYITLNLREVNWKLLLRACKPAAYIICLNSVRHTLMILSFWRRVFRRNAASTLCKRESLEGHPRAGIILSPLVSINQFWFASKTAAWRHGSAIPSPCAPIQLI